MMAGSESQMELIEYDLKADLPNIYARIAPKEITVDIPITNNTLTGI